MNLENIFKKQDIDGLNKIIEEKLDVSTIEFVKFIDEIENPNIEFIEKLLNSGIDINQQDKEGDTALMVACAINDIELIKLFLRYDADISIKPDDDWTALEIAMENIGNKENWKGYEQYKEIIYLFLEVIEDINVYADELLFLFILKDFEIIEHLISCGFDVNFKSENNVTPLSLTIIPLPLNINQISNIKINIKKSIKFLLDNGADIKISTLWIAIMFGNIEIIKFLIDNGADVNTKLNGISPLAMLLIMKQDMWNLALFNQKEDIDFSPIKDKDKKIIAQLLIDNGADIYCTVGGLNLLEISSMKMNKIIRINVGTIEEKECFYSYMNAMNYGDIEVAKFLLKNDMNVDFKNQDEETALMKACITDHIEMVKVLIEHGADVNIKNNQGEKSYLYTNNKEIKRVLINSGVTQERINEKEKISDEELDMRSMSLEELKEENKKLKQKEEDKKEEDKKEKLKMDKLEEDRIRLDSALKYFKETPMTDILKSKDVDDLKKLVDLGYDTSYVNLLDLIVLNYPIEFIRLILKNSKGSIDDKNKGGTTALYMATLLNKKEIVKLLVEYGANLDIQDEEGQTALYMAILLNKKEIVKLLVEHGANLDIQNKKGQTALYMAILLNKKEIVKLLVEHGANLDIQNKKGQTALHMATRRNERKIVKLLVEHGANVDIKDNEGYEAIDSSENFEIDKMLCNPEKFRLKFHHPRDLVQILTNFTIDTPLKYSTHLWDFGNLEKEFSNFKGFLKAIEEQWQEIEKELKKISPNLHQKIYNFLLNKEKTTSWCSQSDINIGWSSLEGLESWCNAGNNPFEFKLAKEYEVEGKTITTFGEVILLFKREIEIRNENNMLEEMFLIEKQKLGRKFQVELINLKGKSFYTDIEKFRNVIKRIFDEMKKRQKYSNIEVKCINKDKDFMELKIIQIDSEAGRDAKEMLTEVDNGDWKIIKESLSNLCDWSIESCYDEQGYQVNYLQSSSTKEIEKLNEIPKGFTHILRFYR